MNIAKLRMLSTTAVVALAFVALFAASGASAQTAVAFQQQHFASHGDGSSGVSSIPCCSANGTYDRRTTKGGLYFAEFNLRKEYGTAQYQPGGTVTIPSGIFSTMESIPLITLPGGNLFAIETLLTRRMGELTFMAGGGIGAAHISPGDFTSMALAAGNDYFEYRAEAHVPQNTPSFRDPMTWAGPNIAGHKGKIRVTPSAAQYGGTREMIWEQFSHGFVPGATSASVAEFFFPVKYGGLIAGLPHGQPLMAEFDYNFTTTSLTTIASPRNSFVANDVLSRDTGSAPFKLRAAPCCTGMVFVTLPGTGWFTYADFTTGTIQILANTLGVESMDFSTRTEMGFNSITTSMGEVFGQIQLVSGGLLNSRGATLSNLAHTHNTLIKFAPEPGSAALIGAGALGLLGLAIRDRRRS